MHLTPYTREMLMYEKFLEWLGLVGGIMGILQVGCTVLIPCVS
jgi:hypothetical protein